MPVLALNGSRDLQVPPSQNLPAIAAALKAGGNKDFETVELPGLNHLFQTCQKCTVGEYGDAGRNIFAKSTGDHGRLAGTAYSLVVLR